MCKVKKNFRCHNDLPTERLENSKLGTALIKQIFPPVCNFRLCHTRIDACGIYISLTSKATSCLCPDCGKESCHTRGFQERTVTSVPFNGKSVKLILLMKKFACQEKSCKRKFFTQQIASYINKYARFSCDCQQLIRRISSSVSSLEASSILRGLGVGCCPNTCINRLLEIHYEPDRSARHIGIDDFAFKKGHTYGTVIVNQQTHEVIEILDSRNSEVVGAALARYPNLESITRDRGQHYVAAIKIGAPQAQAIADRFHIIKNLSDPIYMPIRKDFDAYWRKLARQGDLAPRTPVLTMGWLLERFYARIEDRGNSRQRKKLQCWKEVNRLYVKENMTISQIAKRLHMKPTSVRRMMETSWEENAIPLQVELSRNIKRIAQAAVEAGVLDTGIINARLGSKVNKAGLADMLSLIRREWEAILKKHAEELKYAVSKEALKKNRDELWRKIFIYGHKTDSKAVSMFLENEHVKLIAYYCSTLQGIIKGKLQMPLSKWMNAAMASGDENIEQFAKGVIKDYKAIHNAITKKYSNGLLEGTVCKIKCIKRIMYGKARCKLLYAKIVYKNTERCTIF